METGGFVGGTPRLILRMEGAAVFALSLFAYHLDGASWWLFVILILAPDLSALGYLAGQRAGNACYNAAHNYLPPVALAACTLAGAPPILMRWG